MNSHKCSLPLVCHLPVVPMPFAVNKIVLGLVYAFPNILEIPMKVVAQNVF